jgi:hypothetical protein
MPKTEVEKLHATMWIGYWKEGDDLAGFVKRGKSASKTLEDWADFIEHSAKKIREVAAILHGKKGVSVDGGAHMVFINGLDEKTLKELEKTEVVQREETDGE